MFEFLQSTSI